MLRWEFNRSLNSLVSLCSVKKQTGTGEGFWQPASNKGGPSPRDSNVVFLAWWSVVSQAYTPKHLVFLSFHCEAAANIVS